MSPSTRACRVVAGVALLACTHGLHGREPWIIAEPTVVRTPMSVGDVIVVSGGSLLVTGVPSPGLQVSGNLWVVGDGVVHLDSSVIQFMSTYHGQYSFAGIDQAELRVTHCEYRVPNGVQHALLVAGEASLSLEDSDFGDTQLLSAQGASLRAERTNGRFEVILQDDSEMELTDIPRSPGGGELWVWVEFPEGCDAVYSPPLPGFVESWSFPPEGAVGIGQRCTLTACQTLLWPMLVRQGSRLTLRDIPPEHWVVVGLHLPTSTVVAGLENGLTADSARVPLDDRVLRLDHASVDTWNLYPQRQARVEVRDCWLGEILTMDDSVLVMEDSVIDGTGGYFGAGGRSTAVAYDSTFTCTVQASASATIRLHGCEALPYPIDTTGQFTRFGAHDSARILADATLVESLPVLGGYGAIAATWIADPPQHPPASGAPVTLTGTVAVFSLGGGPAMERWRLEALPRWAHSARLLGAGDQNVEGGTLGVWEAADPHRDYRLRLVVTDTWGRTLTGSVRVPPVAGSAWTRGPATRHPTGHRRTDGPARMRPVPGGPATVAVPDRPLP